MPLLGCDAQVRIKKEGAQPILVFSEHGRSIGLIIDEIVDIAEERLDVKITGDRPGILGHALIRGATSLKSSTSGFSWPPEVRSVALHER